MESKANNTQWESYLRKATDAFDLVEFDNTHHSVAAAKAQAELTRLTDKAEHAQKQLDAADLMLKDMHDRRDVLAKDLDVATKESQDAEHTCGLKTVVLDNLKLFLRGFFTDLLTISKPWERPQKDPGSTKTRSTVRYWMMIMLVFAIDPTPRTKSQLEKVLKIGQRNRAFTFALHDMCVMKVLVRYGGDRTEYQFHPSVIEAMGCKYITAPSVVTISEALHFFSHGTKGPDESDHEP